MGEPYAFCQAGPGRHPVNGAAREVEVKPDPVQAPAIQTAEELPANLCYLRLNGIYARSGKDIVSALRGWACAAAC